MNLDISSRQAHESPEFRDLVSREIQSETRDEILTLKNTVTSLQYRDYLARPENQDVIQSVRESGFKYLKPRSKILYRELLIVCKLWIIKDSTVNFIKVDDALDDSISFADNSLLDQHNNLRSGLLPLFDRFYLSDQNAVFRSQNGRDMNFLKSGINVGQVFIDFTQVPILENMEGVNADGETVQIPHIRINMVLDDQGNEYPATNIFVPVNKLQTQSRVERFQSDISEMFAPENSFEDVRKMIEDNTLDEPELTKVIEELPLYSKFYQRSGDQICKQIIDYVLDQKQNYMLFFSPNLRFIRQLIGSNKTIQMSKSIISKLDQMPVMDFLFWRNILEFRHILGKEFIPAYTNLMEKLFDKQRSRRRGRLDLPAANLSFLFEHSRELFGDQSEIYLAEVISKLQERGINVLTISNFHYLSNDVVTQAISDLPEELIYSLIRQLDEVCLALEIPKSELITRLGGLLRESTFERFIYSLSDNDIDLELVSGHLGLIVNMYKFNITQLGELLVKSDDLNFNISILNELNAILDRNQIAEFCSIVISNLNFNVVRRNINTFSKFYEGIDSLNSIQHRLVFIDCYQSIKDSDFNDETDLDQFIFSSSLLRIYRESTYIDTVTSINDFHEFSSLNSKSLDELYLLLIVGGPHMYTSTFNGVFNKFLEVLKSKDTEVLEFLTSCKFIGFRRFIKMCATFHRFDDLSELMTDESMSQLLTKIFNQLELSGSSYLSHFVSAAEILELLPEKYIKRVSSLLLANYNRVEDIFAKKFKSLYGLLISIVVNKHNISSGDLFEISRKYPIKSTTSLRSSEMFTEHPENPNLKLNVQVHLFYDDKDARASFNSFMSNYPNPKVENDHFVIIEQRQGTKVVRMYVSKPANDAIGVMTNYNALKQSLGRLPVHMLVHRGHSYHVNDSLPRINENTRLVFLGSCGGYSRVAEVNYRSIGAQIISTSGTGTMSINNPLIRDINKSLLSEVRIDWAEFWSRHGEKYSYGKPAQRWPYYIGPHRNIALNFLNAYHSLK